MDESDIKQIEAYRQVYLEGWNDGLDNIVQYYYKDVGLLNEYIRGYRAAKVYKKTLDKQ